jgi:hypothetical protein
MPRRRTEPELKPLSPGEAADEVARHSRKLAQFTQQAVAALGAD